MAKSPTSPSAASAKSADKTRNKAASPTSKTNSKSIRRVPGRHQKHSKTGYGYFACLYEDMLMIRRFEEKAGQFYGMGMIGGFCHLYIGQSLWSGCNRYQKTVIVSLRHIVTTAIC